MNIDAGILAGIAGVLLSLIFAYVPRATEWYEALAPTPKRQVMLGLTLVAALIAIGVECRTAVECYTANWQAVVTAFFAAAVSNQTTYSMVSKNSARAKAARKGA